MASFTGAAIKDVYKDILHTDNSNTGISSVIKTIKCGDGDSTALSLSTNNLRVQPASDSTSSVNMRDADGNSLFTVDSTNDLVKAGVGQHTVNTQYSYFGVGSQLSQWAGASADTHYAVPFNGITTLSLFSLGTGTNPDASTTSTTQVDDNVGSIWYVMDNITIDRVVWWSGGDAATGEITIAHLMGYDIDNSNGSTGGDLSNGTVLADGGSITNAGYEQSYYQQMTIQSANVDAGKAIAFAFKALSSVNSDYTINATVKYHLR